jgi:hypothetical protein
VREGIAAGTSKTRASEVDMGTRESARALGPAGWAAVIVAVVVYWVAAGFIGWSVAWSDAPGPGLPSPGALMWPNELQPMFDERMGGGRGGGDTMSYDVGDDEGQVVVEFTFAGRELSETVPPRQRPGLDAAQRHARDLAFAEGEDAFARWEAENDPPQPYVPLPRTPPLIDLRVACLRLVVSAYDVPDPDPEGVAEVEELLRERLEDVVSSSWELCRPDGWWYEGE